MKRPKRKKGEGDLSFAYRIACWISDPMRIAKRQLDSMPKNEDGTITIKRPQQYRRAS